MSNLIYIRRKQTSRYVLTITNLEDYVKLWEAQNRVNVTPPTYPAYNSVVNTLDAIRSLSYMNNSPVYNASTMIGIPNNNQYLFEPMFSGSDSLVPIKIPDLAIQNIYPPTNYFNSGAGGLPAFRSRWRNSGSDNRSEVQNFGGIFSTISVLNGTVTNLNRFNSIPDVIVWKTLPRLRIPSEATITNIKISFQKMYASGGVGNKNITGTWMLFKKKVVGEPGYNVSTDTSICEINPDLASPYNTWDTWNWRVYFFSTMGGGVIFNDEVNFFPTSGGNWNTSNGTTLGLEAPFTQGITPDDLNNGKIGLVFVLRGFYINEWSSGGQSLDVCLRNITLTVSIS